MTAVDALGKLMQGGVYQVRAVLLYNVQQSEAELQLRVQLEERQIDITTHSHLEVNVKGFHPERAVLARRQVDGRIQAGYQVRPEIIVARRGKLHIQGK